MTSSAAGLFAGAIVMRNLADTNRWRLKSRHNLSIEHVFGGGCSLVQIAGTGRDDRAVVLRRGGSVNQAPTDFRLEVSRALETVVLFVHGEVDLATAPMLDHALRDLIWDQGNLRVVLDLREVTFIDSTGLRVLLQASDAMAKMRGELALSAPSDRVMKLLCLTGLDRKIPISRTRYRRAGCAQAADRDGRQRA